jgi:hypothetical protein
MGTLKGLLVALSITVIIAIVSVLCKADDVAPAEQVQSQTVESNSQDFDDVDRQMDEIEHAPVKAPPKRKPAATDDDVDFTPVSDQANIQQ